MIALRLPIEIQVMILALLVPQTTNWHNTVRVFLPDRTVYYAHLAALFIAAGTTSPALPPASLTKWFDFERPIKDIDNPLFLRIALAWALPAWRDALRDVPSLWKYIVVSVSDETWGTQVLDAIREAVGCAREEPLCIVIARAPTEIEQLESGVSEEGDLKAADPGVKVGKEDTDDGEGERGRVAQVMALLVPHLAHWVHLRIDTLHSIALPVPAVDFAGDAPMLERICLSGIIPTPTAASASASLARALDVPNLAEVTVDSWVFCAAFLCDPGMFSHVRILKLCGSDIKDRRGPPTTSVRELLAYVAQMPELSSLTLDSVHLGVELEGQESAINTSTVLRSDLTLHCKCLSAAVLGEVLNLAIPGSDETMDGGYRELHISNCSLPRSPSLRHYGHIALGYISTGEDFGAFLNDAGGCVVLEVEDCPKFPIEVLARRRPTSAASTQWLLPSLLSLYIYGQTGIQSEDLLEVVRTRREATVVETMECADLNGQEIY